MIIRISILILFTFTIVKSEGKNEITIRIPDVKPKYADVHVCTSIAVDPTEEIYLTSFEPMTTMEIAHHMFIRGCKEPGSEAEVWNCRSKVPKQPDIPFARNCKDNSKMDIIYLWGRNSSKLELPKDVGYAVGGKTGIHYIVLEVHYATIERFENDPTLSDNSGIRITYSPTPLPKTASIYYITTFGRILSNTTEYFEAACKIKDDVVVHPFAFRVHTHGLGLVASGYKVTKDKKSQIEEWTLIGKKDPLLPQSFYPIENEMIIQKGDILATRCTMHNYRNHTVRYGYTDADEMCSYYVMFWTKSPQRFKNYCTSKGPPVTYWPSYDLQGYPDAEASTLEVGESAKEKGFIGEPV